MFEVIHMKSVEMVDESATLPLKVELKTKMMITSNDRSEYNETSFHRPTREHFISSWPEVNIATPLRTYVGVRV